MNRSKPTARPRASRAAPRQEEAFAEIMRSLLTFMLDSGMNRAELGALLDAALGAAYAQRAEASRMRQHSAAVSGLLFAWHREPACLDGAARPRPLPLRGAAPSVESLAREHCAADEVAAVLEAVRRQRHIIPAARGRWLPSGPVATFREPSKQLSGYVGEAILNLMNTIQANLSARRRGRPGAPLIERAALVRDLPQRLAAEFRSHVQEQGTAFLANIDDWLEAHRTAGLRGRAAATGRRRAGLAASEEPGLTAGVHVFAFLGERPPRRRR